MRWFNHLYVGDKAKKKRFRIIQGIRNGRLQIGAYVITPASNGNNILDIYPSVVLQHPYYQKKDLLILGIAADYWDALETVRQIVDEMYQITGGFDLQEFISRKEQ